MFRSKSKLLCRSCDLVVQVPPYRQGYRCLCPQCGTQLRSGHKVNIYNLAVVSIASVILLFTSLTLPFMSISSMGISQSMSLTSIFFILRRDWAILLYICILFTFLCPLIVHSIVIAVVFFKLKVTPKIANIYTLSHRFCMVDVFILGVLVSLVKLMGLAEVHFHVGFYCAIVFAILMVWCCSHGRPHVIWDLIKTPDNELKYAHIGMRGIDQGLMMCRHCGMVFKLRGRKVQTNLAPDSPKYIYRGGQHCPRCKSLNDYRVVACYQKTIALLLAAIIIYVPSNIYPIMVTSYLGNSTSSNIMDGVISLWGMGSQFVAIVILVASICIPVIKIVCILWLLYIAHYGTKRSPAIYNTLYRAVLFIGRWSMIDVFVVILMSTIVRMSGLLTISPGIAIVCFSFVVLLTMISAEEFDERLLWDSTFRARYGTVDQYNKVVTHHAVTDQDTLAAEANAAAAAASAASAATTTVATNTANSAVANTANTSSSAVIATASSALASGSMAAATATSMAAVKHGAAQGQAVVVPEGAETYRLLRTYDLLQRVQQAASSAQNNSDTSAIVTDSAVATDTAVAVAGKARAATSFDSVISSATTAAQRSE